MSFDVYTFILDENGEFKNTIDEASGRAGGNSMGERLYNSPVVKSLGCSFLPSLSQCGALFAFPREGGIDRLRQEARVILDNVEVVAQATSVDAEYITPLMTNILKAIEKAEEINGGVVIW